MTTARPVDRAEARTWFDRDFMSALQRNNTYAGRVQSVTTTGSEADKRFTVSIRGTGGAELGSITSQLRAHESGDRRKAEPYAFVSVPGMDGLIAYKMKPDGTHDTANPLVYQNGRQVGGEPAARFLAQHQTQTDALINAANTVKVPNPDIDSATAAARAAAAAATGATPAVKAEAARNDLNGFGGVTQDQSRDSTWRVAAAAQPKRATIHAPPVV